MKVQKVAQIIFENDSKMCLVAFVSVVSFLAVITIINVLVTRELSKDLELLRTQVQTHQDDIKILKSFLKIDNNHRRKRSIPCKNFSEEEFSITPATEVSQSANDDIILVSTTEKHVEQKRKKNHGKRIVTATENLQKQVVSDMKHMEHKHRKHHRHEGRKFHKKEDDLMIPENITSFNQNFNISPTTEEIAFTLPLLTLQPLNDSTQSSSDLKYITKRSYDRYPPDNSPELSPYTDEGVVMDTQSRETRSRNTYVPPKNSRRKPPPSIHLNGDTSRYQLGVHENYNGNGHLRHPNTRFVDWVPSNWVRQTGMLHNHFDYSDGYLTIKETGIYLVYAQVHYYDQHDENAFRVYRNGQWFLQCTAAAHSVNKTLKGSSCYTAAAEYLYENDKIHLADIVHDRYSIFGTGMSFFGVIKLQ